MEEEQEVLSTEVTEEKKVIVAEDQYGVLYIEDGQLFLRCKDKELKEYAIK